MSTGPRVTVAFVWIYHGVFPKLLGPHPDELAMNMATGMSHEQAHAVAMLGGIGEVIFGLGVLILWRQRWPLVLSAVAMAVLLAFVIGYYPVVLTAAFNPVTTNIGVLALSLVAYSLRPQSTLR
ncbi:DoxX-like family protein [Halioxenophilus aromaticivorans]|uniref:DoxX-like family protein n=1 Tax=Halioxenophilus aromaticivorans TaxID=1306992 RepID=A0AAV3U4W8_9ALTE